MLLMFGFIYFSVTVLIWSRSFALYKAKIHEFDTNRPNEIKEHWSYQDQYWGMLFSNRSSFPLYREELEPYIARVRSTLAWVLSGILVAITSAFI